MKRTIIAVALAAVAATSFAAGQYTNNAGDSDSNTVVKQQLGDASDSYRFNAGDQDRHQPQMADAGKYRNNAGEQDSSSVLLG